GQTHRGLSAHLSGQQQDQARDSTGLGYPRRFPSPSRRCIAAEAAQRGQCPSPALGQYRNILLVDHHVDVYPLLRSVDVLITDYSSGWFDYLILDRPILFYAYDLEDYLKPPFRTPGRSSPLFF